MFVACVVASVLKCWNSMSLRLGEKTFGNARSFKALGFVANLSGYAAFALRSSEIKAVDQSDRKLATIMAEQREDLYYGKLFIPLLPVAAAGAVLVSHIVESGPIDADHLICLFPLLPLEVPSVGDGRQRVLDAAGDGSGGLLTVSRAVARENILAGEDPKNQQHPFRNSATGSLTKTRHVTLPRGTLPGAVMGPDEVFGRDS